MLRWALGICIIYLRCIKNRNSSNTPTTTTNYYWPIFRQCSFYVSLVIFAVPINISILRLLANACYDNISIIHDHDSYERINVWMCVSSSISIRMNIVPWQDSIIGNCWNVQSMQSTPPAGTHALPEIAYKFTHTHTALNCFDLSIHNV